MGGIKVGRSRASLPLRVEVERLRPPEDFLGALEQHLLLVYTGKTRLARNLLQVGLNATFCPVFADVRCIATVAFVCRTWFAAGTVVCLPSFRTRTTWWPTRRSVPGPA